KAFRGASVGKFGYVVIKASFYRGGLESPEDVLPAFRDVLCRPTFMTLRRPEQTTHRHELVRQPAVGAARVLQNRIVLTTLIEPLRSRVWSASRSDQFWL